MPEVKPTLLDFAQFKKQLTEVVPGYGKNNTAIADELLREFFTLSDGVDENEGTLDSEYELRYANNLVRTKYEAIKNKEKPAFGLNDSIETEDEIFDAIYEVDTIIGEKANIIYDFLDKEGWGSHRDFADRVRDGAFNGTKDDCEGFVNELTTLFDGNDNIKERVEKSGVWDLLTDIQNLVDKRSQLFDKLES